ncbi:VCBS repeat-containing protein [Aurantibacter crassamenti]|nr:VCBS repeat-containing protein [Aurantibacter crassamenti]
MLGKGNNKVLILFIFYFTLLTTSCKKNEFQLFTKISSNESGITFNNKIVETDSFNILTSEYIFNGGGVAIGDFNNDKKPDVFFTGNQTPNKLYLNKGDFKFEDVSNKAGIEADKYWNTGVALVDINNDNLLDIYLCSAMLPTEKERQNLLFINQGIDKDGNPSFKEMSQQYGIADYENSMGATFFDYNKDGFLDLYVLNNVDVHILPTNYRAKITDGTALSNDKLYRNNGDGTFTDVSIEAGITIEGYGLGLAISDLNYDGWPDIYVSNDYLSNDLLYINNQDGTFSNQIQNFIKHQSKFSMGSDISDYDNDGNLDIITLDMLGETNQRLKTTISNNSYTSYQLNESFGYEYQYSRNMLQKGNGPNTPFSEIGLMAGIARTDWSWSPLFVDMDNDGFKDILISNGFPRDITDTDFGDFRFNMSRYLSTAKILDSIPQVKIPNYAYHNDGVGRFKDVGEEWGLNIPSFSNGAAYADLDNDGDLDYIVNNINDEAFIFKNNINDITNSKHNYISLNLVGPKSNIKGIGAKVVLRLENDAIKFHEYFLNRGYMSTVQDIVHFGLGSTEKISAVEILWPNGKYQKIDNVLANQTLTIQYNDAIKTNIDALNFPLTDNKNKTIFNEISEELGVEYVHQEKDIVDYYVQPILPHKFTQNGPCLVKGDLNGDGTEDFIVGSSSRFSPQVFTQNEDGTFNQSSLVADAESMIYEEEDLILFDLENDGDLDLYLISGSNESMTQNDRLMLNDGKGNFELAQNKMPDINASGSVATAYDYDNDGFVDLFIGGRTPYSKFPLPEKSFLLKNENGILKDVTDSVAPELRKIGMVTDAIWADIDSDNIKDLIVIGEYMPITIFKNDHSQLRQLKNTNLDDLFGWWETIETADFDGDGDADFIVGNLGANNLYQPSKDRPVTLISKDFDTNGTIDPVMFAYFKNDFKRSTYEPFPVNFWGDLNKQSPLFRSKFNSYNHYAKATQLTMFDKNELDDAHILTGNYDKSIYLENIGDGKFKYSQLPWEAQIAPINSIVITDYNDDNNLDVILIGNDYGNEIFIGRYDAFNGCVLQGNGNGAFTAVKTSVSGFNVNGDAKDLISVNSNEEKKPYYIASQNRGELLIFQQN